MTILGSQRIFLAIVLLLFDNSLNLGGDVMNDMTPYEFDHRSLGHLIPREDPLSALAASMPDEVASILNRQLDLQKHALRVEDRKNNLETLKSMSRDSAAAACTWLQARPDETQFDDDMQASVTHGSFFSSETTSVRFSRRIRTG